MTVFGIKLPNMSSLLLWGLLWEFIGQIELTFFLPPLSAIFATLLEIGGTKAFITALKKPPTRFQSARYRRL